MIKIKRNDTVKVISGKDRGKQGKVLRVFQGSERAIVERINLVKKHLRRRREDQQSGIVSLEAPIALSSLMMLCKHCNKPTRVGFTKLKDGKKVRLCKKCKEII